MSARPAVGRWCPPDKLAPTVGLGLLSREAWCAGASARLGDGAELSTVVLTPPVALVTCGLTAAQSCELPFNQPGRTSMAWAAVGGRCPPGGYDTIGLGSVGAEM